MQLRQILHPTDFSDSATQALRQAVRLAVAHDATLHVYHGILLHTDGRARADREMQEYLHTARREAEALGRIDHLKLESACDRSYSIFDSVMDKTAALRPDLLVVGTHGRSGVTKFVMGSEAEKLLRHSPCNLVMLRAGTPCAGEGSLLRRVLVPVDFSDHSRRALDAARALVADAAKALVLLHAVERGRETYEPWKSRDRLTLDPELSGRIELKLREWAGTPVSDAVVAAGSPAQVICRVGTDQGADMVIMGTRGLSGYKRLIIGSVTERVCRHCAVPVFTVK